MLFKKAKFFFFIVYFSGLFLPEAFAKDVYIEGYTRSNGTYVEGHYRSAPDSTINNNFSTEGNVNPYTGETGWIERESYSRSNSGYYQPTSNTAIDEDDYFEWPDSFLEYFLWFLFICMVITAVQETIKWIKNNRVIASFGIILLGYGIYYLSIGAY